MAAAATAVVAAPVLIGSVAGGAAAGAAGLGGATVTTGVAGSVGATAGKFVYYVCVLCTLLELIYISWNCRCYSSWRSRSYIRCYRSKVRLSGQSRIIKCFLCFSQLKY